MRAAMKRVGCYEKSCNNEDGACDFSSGKIASSSTVFCLTETVSDDDGSFVSTQTSAAQPQNLPGGMGTFSPHKNSKKLDHKPLPRPSLQRPALQHRQRASL